MEDGTTKTAEKAAARVFVIEDHTWVREQLVAFIEREPDFFVCGVADDVSMACSRFGETAPDVVVLGLSARTLDVFGLLTELSQSCPGLPVLVLSMSDSSSYVRRALAAGAMGCMTKQEAVTQLLVAIRTLLAGRIYTSQPGPGRAAPVCSPDRVKPGCL